MACDDFTQAITKYKLIPNKKTLEENKKKREMKLTNIYNGKQGSDLGS